MDKRHFMPIIHLNERYPVKCAAFIRDPVQIISVNYTLYRREKKMTFATLILGLVLVILPVNLFAANSMYCPQNHQYIQVGMTIEQVLAACGNPLSEEELKEPLYQKVPVQQLIYNNQGTDTAFYGVWNIPIGSGGAQLQIDLMNDKVKSIRLNGGDINAASLCEGINIQIGDSSNKVYNACGSPDVTNYTFVKQAIPTASKPKIWIYQPTPYQPTISLTFVDGRLESINN
jgi:hypothetical protein